MWSQNHIELPLYTSWVLFQDLLGNRPHRHASLTAALMNAPGTLAARSALPVVQLAFGLVHEVASFQAFL
jgi:hypothetical protein